MTEASIRAIYEEFLHGVPIVMENNRPAESELVWQARWFSGACGRVFKTLDGRSVEVTSFGEWNREAGPDFTRVHILLDGQECSGGLELDMEAAGWEDHRHATNPAYENVVLHVLVHRPRRRAFARTATHREVPQVCLADHSPVPVEWAVTAPIRPGRCSGTLVDLNSERLVSLLRVAAQRRLEQKATRLSTAIDARGLDAATFEALAATLGYKNNKLPFQLLAQRIPQKLASSSTGEALLFGIAGFLEKPQPPGDPARAELRSLWQDWWKLRAAHAHLVLPRTSWQLAGLRPANHPLRRLAALVVIARQWHEVFPAIQSGDFARLSAALTAIRHPFWSHHTSFSSKTTSPEMALLGTDRIREIYVNLVLPLLSIQGSTPAWHELPASPANSTSRIVVARLFRGETPPRLPRKLFVQQGLLQIYQDFCQREPDDCHTCRFPSLIERLTT
jgi:hypothetical protein